MKRQPPDQWFSTLLHMSSIWTISKEEQFHLGLTTRDSNSLEVGPRHFFLKPPKVIL